MTDEKKTLGLVFFPAFDWMISPAHPERQERLLYTRDQLEEEGLFDLPQIREYRPRLAAIEDLQRAHVGVPSVDKLVTRGAGFRFGEAAGPSRHAGGARHPRILHREHRSHHGRISTHEI